MFMLACASAGWVGEKREQSGVVGADVDSQAQVVQTQVDTDASKGIAAVLDLALKRWQLVPALHEGRPATVHTLVKARLEAIPADAGKYRLRISCLRHGPKWNDRLPTYPAQASGNATVALSCRWEPRTRMDASQSASLAPHWQKATRHCV